MATMMEVQQDAAIRQYQLDRDRREQVSPHCQPMTSYSPWLSTGMMHASSYTVAIHSHADGRAAGRSHTAVAAGMQQARAAGPQQPAAHSCRVADGLPTASCQQHSADSLLLGCLLRAVVALLHQCQQLRSAHSSC